MEWRTIPGLEAYEISEGGTVRKRTTGYRMRPCGRKYKLWDGYSYRFLAPRELVDRAFGQPAAAAEPAPTPPVPADELGRLRARVAELEAEVTWLRAHPKPKPQPKATAKPKTASAKSGEKKRYCVVCGRVLPDGYWRRCPEHAFRENGYTADDFSGAVVR